MTAKLIHMPKRELLVGACCAFGVFDGVHRGHQELISAVVRDAEDHNAPSVIISFDRDPDEILHPDTLKKVMSDESRLRELGNLDADYLMVLPCREELLSLSPREFLNRLFDGGLARSMHVGTNFHFGQYGKGNLVYLKKWGQETGVEVYGHDLLLDEGKPVSSSRIRSLLAKGDVQGAAKLLGRPYRIEGIVRPGRGEGFDLGFRTANLDVEPKLRVLGEGVYAAWAQVAGRSYKAAVSVGVSPTFADTANSTCEVHLIDFDEAIYGVRIEVDFVDWMRPLKVFQSRQDLSQTVLENIDWVRKNL